jgi:hypothetical protein
MQELLVASIITNDAIGCELNYPKGQQDKAPSDCIRTLAIATAMLIKACLAYDTLSFCSRLCLVRKVS